MGFRVGQRVVCINAQSANTPDPRWCVRNLAKVLQDEIYTISNITIDDFGTWFTFDEVAKHTEFESRDFKPLELDHEFVNEVIKQVTPKKQEV